LFGLLALFTSKLSFSTQFENIDIDFPFSLFFPVFISISFGWRYGLASGFAGGALHPFILWPEDGWANVGTALLYSLYFATCGFFFNKKIIAKTPQPFINVSIISVLFIPLFYIYFGVFFNKFLSLNPTFWYPQTISHLDTSILIKFAIKDSINLIIVTYFAEALTRINSIRKLIGLTINNSMKNNNYILLLSILSAISFFLILYGFNHVFNNDNNFRPIHPVLFLFFLVFIAILIARVLFHYFEKQTVIIEKIKESETMFRLLFENMTNGFILHEVILDEKTNEPYDIRILEINDLAAAFHNQKRSEVVNKTIRELTSTFNPDAHSKTISVALTGRPIDFELYNKYTDDFKHIIMYSPQKNRVATILEDINIQKKNEISLKINQERLRKIVNSLTDYIYSVKIEHGEITDQVHGEACLTVTGYSAHEFAMNPDLWNSIILLEDNLIQKSYTQQIQSGIETPAIEIRIRHKNSGIRWVRIESVIQRDDKHEIKGYDRLISDITTRKTIEIHLKESEELYRSLYENANDAIFIIESNLIVDCNYMSCLLFGYSNKELLYRTPDMLSPELQPDGQRSADKAKAILSEVVQGTNKRFEWMHKHPQKGNFEAEVSLNRIKISGKWQIMAIVRDVSERKKFEREIYFSSLKGEENERTRIARELHDGMGPLLSTCKIYLHTMKPAETEPKNKETIDKLGIVLDDALNTIKEISNNLSPHILRNYGLIVAINTFIEKLKFTIDIKITIDIPSDKRFNEIIELSIYRVLTELINNTLNYSEASSIVISIILESEKFIRIKYADNGKGFDVQKTMEQRKGNGLSNIHMRIQNIGGKVQIISSEGKGMNAFISIFL